MFLPGSLFRNALLASAAVSLLAAPAFVEVIPATMASSANGVNTVGAIGDAEFLRNLRVSMQQYPTNVAAIARGAKETRPELAQEIDLLADELAPDAPEEAANSLDQASVSSSGSGSVSSGLMVGGLVAAGGVAGVLAMAGGGGGSDGGDRKDDEPDTPAPPPSDPPPPKLPEPPKVPPPSYSDNPEDYVTGEYQDQWGLGAIKANEAYARGYSGHGVIVAVVDSGLDADHPEFEGRIHAPYNAYTDEHGNSYDSEHGTHVAGIIGAGKDGDGMHGVAWSSTIMPINFANEIGYMRPGPDGIRVGRAWRHAARNGARVINNSWTTPGNELGDYDRASYERDFPEIVSAMEELLAADIVNVMAAGNQDKDNPRTPSTLPTEFPELEGYWVTVVALDSNDQIASYSNACGVTSDWCIAAPGNVIRSSILEGNYGSLSGTSMATPHVTGTVAILREAFPYMSAPEITSLLFETADELGDKSVYGHGMLNLERATRPVGSLAVPMGSSIDGRSLSLNGSSLRLSPAFGDGVAHALAGQSVMALDDYNRGYEMDLGNFVSPMRRNTRQDALHRLTLFSGLEERSISTIETGPFSMTTATRLRASDSALGSTPYSRMSFGFAGDSYSMEASMNPDLGRSFGLREEGFGRAPMIDVRSFDQPHLGLMESGFGASFGFDMSDRSSLRMAAFTGNVSVDERSLFSDAPSMFGGVAQMTADLSNQFALQTSFGAVSEEGSLLGSVSRGAFGENMRSNTLFASLGGLIEVAPSTMVTFTGSLGNSSFKQGGGMIRGGDDIVTSSFGIGMSHQGIFQDGDAFSLAASQPLRVESGAIDLVVPTSRSMNGSIGYSRMSLSPQPSGRELDLQASYSFELMEGIQASVGAMHRFDADHMRGRQETIGMFTTSFRF